VFFASSLYLKKPSRIMGLLMVMTLALLVYSVAQRRLRSALTQHNETLPNQINQPTNTPTLRWIFQMMDGIHSVKMQVNNVIHKIVEGLTPLKKKIISFFGQTVMKIYGIEKSICREWG
jgi:transposase